MTARRDMLVILLAVCGLSWAAWQENIRPKMYVQLGECRCTFLYLHPRPYSNIYETCITDIKKSSLGMGIQVKLMFSIYSSDPEFQNLCFVSPVFQPDCRLVAVTLPQSGINDEKKAIFPSNHTYLLLIQ
jgi:hypothetical protein